MKKVLTALVVVGMGLLVAWPFVLGKQPAREHTRALELYTLRFGLYVCVLLIVFFAMAALAWALWRKAREEYREAALNNMKFLIETTLADHRKQDENHDA